MKPFFISLAVLLLSLMISCAPAPSVMDKMPAHVERPQSEEVRDDLHAEVSDAIQPEGHGENPVRDEVTVPGVPAENEGKASVEQEMNMLDWLSGTEWHDGKDEHVARFDDRGLPIVGDGFSTVVESSDGKHAAFTTSRERVYGDDYTEKVKMTSTFHRRDADHLDVTFTIEKTGEDTRTASMLLERKR